MRLDVLLMYDKTVADSVTGLKLSAGRSLGTKYPLLGVVAVVEDTEEMQVEVL